MHSKIEATWKPKSLSHELQVKITWKYCSNMMSFNAFLLLEWSVLLLVTASLFLCRSRTCMFAHAFYIHRCARLYLSIFWWSVYLSCSLCTRTSSRHAYFLCTWMAISAALPITIIYIKFEINFTLFSLRNYVNSCCETKLHTWILIAVSFKSLWTLERKTQHYGNIPVISSQGFSVMEGRRNWSLSMPCFSLTKTTELSLDPSVHPSVCQPLNTETWDFTFLNVQVNFKLQQGLKKL